MPKVKRNKRRSLSKNGGVQAQLKGTNPVQPQYRGHPQPVLRQLPSPLMKLRNKVIAKSVGKLQSDNLMIMRGDELTLTDPVDGIYNQLLFDLCAPNAMLSMHVMGTVNPIVDILGVLNNGADTEIRNFITYIGPEGTAAGTADDDHGIQTDACGPGSQVEAGGYEFGCTGWTKWRRSGYVRDATDAGQRYCETQPVYLLNGERIDNDAMWDRMRLAVNFVNDLHYLLIAGDAANANETDGLEALVNFDKTDFSSGARVPLADSICLDWSDEPLCADAGSVLATVNTNAITDGTDFFDVLISMLRRVKQRIRWSPMNGDAPMFALATTEMIDNIISCWTCYRACGGDYTQIDSERARMFRADLRERFQMSGMITINFDGIDVTFIPYDWDVLENANGTQDMYILTPYVGTNRLIELQFKDLMRIPTRLLPGGSNAMITDGGRFLSYTTHDHTCYQEHLTTQFRLCMPGSAFQICIQNVAVDNILPDFFLDPRSDEYLGNLDPAGPNLVAYPEAAV